MNQPTLAGFGAGLIQDDRELSLQYVSADERMQDSGTDMAEVYSTKIEETMEASEVQRALEAGRSTASALGLRVDDGVVVHNSNRIAVHLTPCDVLARVAPQVHQAGAEFEVEVGRRLAEAGCPVEELEPRVEPRVY